MVITNLLGQVLLIVPHLDRLSVKAPQSAKALQHVNRPLDKAKPILEQSALIKLVPLHLNRRVNNRIHHLLARTINHLLGLVDDRFQTKISLILAYEIMIYYPMGHSLHLTPVTGLHDTLMLQESSCSVLHLLGPMLRVQ